MILQQEHDAAQAEEDGNEKLEPLASQDRSQCQEPEDESEQGEERVDDDPPIIFRRMPGGRIGGGASPGLIELRVVGRHWSVRFRFQDSRASGGQSSNIDEANLPGFVTLKLGTTLWYSGGCGPHYRIMP
jgi:hypothetical protein